MPWVEASSEYEKYTCLKSTLYLCDFVGLRADVVPYWAYSSVSVWSCALTKLVGAVLVIDRSAT